MLPVPLSLLVEWTVGSSYEDVWTVELLLILPLPTDRRHCRAFAIRTKHSFL